MADAIKGLKMLRVPGSKRQDDWNRPNRKAARRLAVRQADFEKNGDKSAGDHQMHKPGSLQTVR